MVYGLCNLYYKQFSFLYIQTVHYDCSHIEHVHHIFCVRLIRYFGVLNLDIITSTPPLECLDCVSVLSVSQTDFIPLYSNFAYNDCSYIEDVHKRNRSRASLVLFEATSLRKIIEYF